MTYSFANSIRRARPLLGTLVEIEARSSAVPHGHEAINAAFEAAALVHRLMSFHEPSSDLSRINSAPTGATVAVHAWTAHVLAFAASLYRESNGLFDPGIAPILVEQGLLPKLQAPASHCSSISNVEVVLDFPTDPSRNQCLVHKHGDCCLDLGGCAKGFAVDVAVETLQTFGIVGGIVNAGGDLRCFGDWPSPIYLRCARTGAANDYWGSLKDMALATSALTFSHPDSPFINPLSKSSVHFHGSVSVTAESALVADALTKVAIIDHKVAASVFPKFKASLYYSHRATNHQEHSDIAELSGEA